MNWHSARLVVVAGVAWLWTGTVFGANPPGSDGLLDEPVIPPIIELRPGSAVEPAAKSPGPVLGNPLWSIALRSLTATLERPIFSRSRRASPPVIANAPQAKPLAVPIASNALEQLTLKLMGTIASRDGGVAILSEDSIRPAIRLRLGESHGGWVLRDVRSHEVSLENGDRIETIVLQRAPVSSTVAPEPAVDPASFLKGMKNGR